MSPAQMRQLEWVKEQMALGNQVVEYFCPECDEPNFGLKRAETSRVFALVRCPHCEKVHFRDVPAPGVLKASRIDN